MHTSEGNIEMGPSRIGFRAVDWIQQAQDKGPMAEFCEHSDKSSGSLKKKKENLLNIAMKMAVFWVVAPCSLVEDYQHFRGACYLHHQDNE
jgi:hypothetical protein